MTVPPKKDYRKGLLDAATACEGELVKADDNPHHEIYNSAILHCVEAIRRLMVEEMEAKPQ